MRRAFIILVTVGSLSLQSVPAAAIWGGSTTSISNYPWLAQVWSNKRFACGGTLVDRRWVLTAAHCVVERDFTNPIQATITKPSELAIVFDQQSPKLVNSFSVDTIAIHPGFPIAGSVFIDPWRDDLALLHLSGARDVAPLPLGDLTNTFDVGPWSTSALGWGCATETAGCTDRPASTLQHTPLLVDRGRCADVGLALAVGPANSSELCTLSAGTSQFRKGDSGGPMIGFDAARSSSVLMGVISTLPAGKALDTISFSAQVADQEGWVRGTIAGSPTYPFVPTVSPGFDRSGQPLTIYDGGGCGTAKAWTSASISVAIAPLDDRSNFIFYKLFNNIPVNPDGRFPARSLTIPGSLDVTGTILAVSSACQNSGIGYTSRAELIPYDT